MSKETFEFLKSLGMDAFMNGGDITESVSKLRSEMAEGMAAQAQPKAKQGRKVASDTSEAEVIDTTGEEVKDASDFAHKYGRKR